MSKAQKGSIAIGRLGYVLQPNPHDSLTQLHNSSDLRVAVKFKRNGRILTTAEIQPQGHVLVQFRNPGGYTVEYTPFLRASKAEMQLLRKLAKLPKFAVSRKGQDYYIQDAVVVCSLTFDGTGIRLVRQRKRVPA